MGIDRLTALTMLHILMRLYFAFRKLNEVFNSFDLDGNGLVEEDELFEINSALHPYSESLSFSPPIQ